MAEFEVPVHEHKRSYSCSDCHKSFLRSEHLSRHRLNHRPKQVFSCTKCPKEFVRSDLLQRHMKRHEKGMHYRSTGGVVRAKLEESSPPSEKEESPVSSEPQILNVLEDFYPTPTVQPANEYPEAIDSSVAAAPAAAIEKQASFIDPSLQDFDFGLSKVNPFFFDASAEFQDVPSDMDWFFGDVLQDTPSAHEYESGSEPVYHPHLQPKDSSILSSEESPWVTVSSKLRSSLGGLSQDVLDSQWFLPSNLAGFYELYFINYHPHFPIFHRATMVPAEIPPLLLAAIITLGSTLSPDSALFEITTKVHDHLRWWVCKNETLEPPAPLWCLQALLLIQAHGKMFSTRRHHELAHIFHGAIITLMRRGSAYTTTRATEKEHSTTMERSWRQWAESESSRRTAFFAFIMDAQHSSLFGHTPVLSVSDIRLSLPCPDSQWDASSPEVWAELDRQSGEPLHFLPVLRSLLGKHPVPASCSAYSRFILLHGLYSITFNLQAKDSSTLGVGTGRLMSAESSTPLIEDWREIIDRAIDTWSFSLLSQTSSLCLDAARPLYRMAHVSIYTSIMDIHIVAGAPSLLGNLLSTSDRSKANSRIRAWSEKAEARKALNHSLLLIQEILFTGRKYIAREDNISLRPWCLYHATLVVWAYGFVTEGRVDHEPVIGAEEYLVGMRTAMVGSVREVKGANRTKGLILTVRESLEDCRWELLQEAYSTLGRLVDIIPSTPSR